MSTCSANRDFSRSTIRCLAAKGIKLIGTTYIQGSGPMPMSSGTVGYVLSDNGTHRIRLHSEVIALAKESSQIKGTLAEAFDAAR